MRHWFIPATQSQKFKASSTHNLVHPPKKFRQNALFDMGMALVFWDCKGDNAWSVVRYMPRNCHVWKRKSEKNWREKTTRWHFVSEPRTYVYLQLVRCDIDLFPHIPYPSDLAASDFYILGDRNCVDHILPAMTKKFRLLGTFWCRKETSFIPFLDCIVYVYNWFQTCLTNTQTAGYNL